MEPAPPVSFNLTFVCPEGEVFDHDWWARALKGKTTICSGSQRPLSRSLVKTLVLLIPQSGTDSNVFFVSSSIFFQKCEIIILPVFQLQQLSALTAPLQVSLNCIVCKARKKHYRNFKAIVTITLHACHKMLYCDSKDRVDWCDPCQIGKIFY